MSFILLATAAAAIAAGAGFLAARRSGKKDAEADGEEEAPPPPPPPPAPKEDIVKKLSTLPLSLGDVVSVEADDASRGGGIGKSHTERWLAGGLALYDGDALLGAVFIAPEGIREEAVAAFAAPRKDIGWLSPVEVELGVEPPSAIEMSGVVLQRKRRLAVRIERLGKGAPRIGDRGIFAEYAATGRAIGVVIRTEQGTVAWSGIRFEAGDYDRMGRAE